MTEADLRLQPLRGALLDAAAADLAASDRARLEVPRPRRRRSTRVRLAVALVAAALAVPAAALAVRALSADQEVANGLPGGSMVLVGTEPSCTPVRKYVEYICLLDKLPREEDVESAPAFKPGTIYYRLYEAHAVKAVPGHWRGYVVDTVDSTHHVNGGCRAENVEGTRWRCFLGEAAVRHQLIGQRLLGEFQSGPVRD